MFGLNKRQLSYNRKFLIDSLKKNLEIHKKEYAEAVSDYREFLLKELTEKLAEVKKTKRMTPLTAESALKKITIDFTFPDSHEKDYVRVIDMLEHAVDENISLDDDSYRAFVKNEWDWTPSFAATVSNYKFSGRK